LVASYQLATTDAQIITNTVKGLQPEMRLFKPVFWDIANTSNQQKILGTTLVVGSNPIARSTIASAESRGKPRLFAYPGRVSSALLTKTYRKITRFS
jgi:hypothetical protein